MKSIWPPTALSYLAGLTKPSLLAPTVKLSPRPRPKHQFGRARIHGVTGEESHSSPGSEIRILRWSSEISAQKWMNFYMKLLSRWATGGGLKLVASVEVALPTGIPGSKAEETKVASRELGLGFPKQSN